MSSSGPMKVLAPDNAWGDQPTELPVARRSNGRLIKRTAILLAVVGFFAGAINLGAWLNSREPARWVLPADFEQHEAILLAWDSDFGPEQYDTLAQIMAACYQNVELTLLTPPALLPDSKAWLKKHGVPESQVDFVPADISLPWTRDFGPLVLKSFDGRVDYLDTVYASNERFVCEEVPRQLADHYDRPCVPLRLVLPGGNILSNGAGLYLTTTTLLEDNQIRFNYKRPIVTSMLSEQLGAAEVIYLEPLAEEPTGHVDVFAAFVAADTVVLGDYDPRFDPVNARILDANAKRLENVRTACGPLRVVRIPMPPRLHGTWWTYTNVVFANGVLVIPTYPDVDPRLQTRAIDTYRNLLKGWDIKTVNGAPLMIGDGGLRCATLNMFRKSASGGP